MTDPGTEARAHLAICETKNVRNEYNKCTSCDNEMAHGACMSHFLFEQVMKT
jgi:hypothetical protein